MADKGLVTSMTCSNRDMLTNPCEPCLEGKQTCEVIHKIAMTHTEYMLSHMHTDICSPLPIHSHCGYQHFVTFIDDSSCFTSVLPLYEKSEVGKLLKTFISWAELETSQKVKILHSDRGGKYIASHVKDYLKRHGIKHEITTPDTPQHNGVAERLNWMLL